MGDHERRLLKPRKDPEQEVRSYAKALDKSIDACKARIDHLIGQYPDTSEEYVEQWNLVSRVRHSAEIEGELAKIRYFRRRRIMLKALTVWFFSVTLALFPFAWLLRVFRGTPKQGS